MKAISQMEDSENSWLFHCLWGQGVLGFMFFNVFMSTRTQLLRFIYTRLSLVLFLLAM